MRPQGASGESLLARLLARRWLAGPTSTNHAPCPTLFLPHPRFVVSPITGELVPIGEMAEHMRVSLIDPKYRAQKEIMLAKIRDTTKGGFADLSWLPLCTGVWVRLAVQAALRVARCGWQPNPSPRS